MSGKYNLIKPAQVDIQKNKDKINRSGILKFPNDLGSHAIVLNFKSYDYSKSTTSNSTVSFNSVVLPLPRNIQESFNIEVRSNEIGIMGAGLVDAKTALFNNTKTLDQFGKDTVDFITSAFDPNQGATADSVLAAANYIKRAGLSYLNNDLSTAIDITTGTFVNPHATLTFNGINLKVFNFDWEITPKSESESNNLQKIIKHIKRSILPSYAAPVGKADSNSISLSRGLLKFPDMVDIFFVGVDQNYFFHFKTCMIDQFSVDYSPNGNVLTKGPTGARPSILTMNMSLREAAIHDKSDYEDDVNSTNWYHK